MNINVFEVKCSWAVYVIKSNIILYINKYNGTHIKFIES